MNYPFSTGDLLCAGQTASSYLDNNTKVCSATQHAAGHEPAGHHPVHISKRMPSAP